MWHQIYLARSRFGAKGDSCVRRPCLVMIKQNGRLFGQGDGDARATEADSPQLPCTKTTLLHGLLDLQLELRSLTYGSFFACGLC